MRNIFCLILIALCLCSCEKEAATQLTNKAAQQELSELTYDECRDLSYLDLPNYFEGEQAMDIAAMSPLDLNWEFVPDEARKKDLEIYITFEWACRVNISICWVIDMMPGTNGDKVMATVSTDGEYLRIVTQGEENGFTKEAILPIFSDMELPAEVAAALGYEQLSIVKGLYQARIKSERNPHNSVVVRVNSTKQRAVLNYEESRLTSLEQLKHFVSTEAASFIDAWEVKDYTYLSDELAIERKIPVIKLRIKDHNNCSVFWGMCLMTSLTTADQYDDSMTKAHIEMINGKLAITPLEGRNGYTSDGVLPMFGELTIDPRVARTLGYQNITVEPGLYQAKYDRLTQQYGTVFVDVETE